MMSSNSSQGLSPKGINTPTSGSQSSVKDPQGPMIGESLVKTGSAQSPNQTINDSGPSSKGKGKMLSFDSVKSGLSQCPDRTLKSQKQVPAKIHGISQPRCWSKQQILSIGKNRLPIDDRIPLFKSDYTAGLSIESLGIIDALFATYNDKTEKARILHVLSNQLFLLENKNIKLQMQVTAAYRELDELKVQNLRLIQQVQHHGVPHLKLQKNMLVSQSRNEFLNNLPRDLSLQILLSAQLRYKNLLQDLYSLAHLADYMKQGLFIKRAKIEESEYHKWTPNEISDMYAHGFIKTIQFENKLPDGLPEIVKDIVHQNKCDGRTVLHINKNTPHWDLNKGCRLYGDTTLIIVDFDYTPDYNNTYEPAIVEEFWSDQHEYQSTDGIYTIYKGSSAQGSNLEIVYEDLNFSDGNHSDPGHCSDIDSDLERELANRMDA
uniref:p46 n=1 Tax=Agapanthus tungrovirus TaxID=2838078 RepID=A0A8E7PF27_9VIRU|nr:p46 [Agapanthus tungrovirus]